jgi:hypothetical protein
MNVEQPSARCVKAVKNAMNAVAVVSLIKFVKTTSCRIEKKNLPWYQETTLNEQIITKTTAGLVIR